MRSLAVAAALSFLAMAGASSAQAIDRISLTVSSGRSMANWHGRADVDSLNLELTHPLSPRWDLGFVVATSAITQPKSWFGDQYGDGEEDVRALGGSLLVRRTWREKSAAASWYAELASGPMWAERRVPAATSRFNFHSQGGVGVVLRPQSRAGIIVGFRFGHISNGGYAPRNPGLNVSSLVVGIRTRLR